MSQVIHQPHDKFFKQAMSDIRVAKEFFITHLPQNILKQVDLNTLKLTKHSFIDTAYKATEADVVYSVTLLGKRAYFYLLIEHQTNIDTLMAFHLWVYVVRLIELHIKQNPNIPLPIVYPLVVYTGQKPWDAPSTIFELFGEQQALAKNILFKSYQLIDIQRIEDEDLRQHLWCGIVEFALKYREVRDIAKFLETMLPWLQELEQHSGVSLAKTVLYYMVAGLEANDADMFIDKTQQHLSHFLYEDVMTLAQQFEQRGEARGIVKGKFEGERNILIRLITRKFGNIPECLLQRIQAADSEMLAIWSEQTLEAATLEDALK